MWKWHEGKTQVRASMVWKALRSQGRGSSYARCPPVLAAVTWPVWVSALPRPPWQCCKGPLMVWHEIYFPRLKVQWSALFWPTGSVGSLRLTHLYTVLAFPLPLLWAPLTPWHNSFLAAMGAPHRKPSAWPLSRVQEHFLGKWNHWKWKSPRVGYAATAAKSL